MLTHARNCAQIALFMYIRLKLDLIALESPPGSRVVKVADFKSEIPGSNPGSDFFVHENFFCTQFSFYSFCAILTSALTHAWSLLKFAKTYIKRKIDATHAHVARLR